VIRECLAAEFQKNRTIEQLVDQHKVVLDVLLGDLAKVVLHNIDDFQQKLEHHCGVNILLCDGSQPDVCTLK
jgi:hypothetical protein